MSPLPRGVEQVERYVRPFSTPVVIYRGSGIDRVASGTYIQHGGTPYILTAAHVADAVMDGTAVGISRDRDINRFTLSPNVLTVSKFEGRTGGESGPDLATIRIPPYYQKDIEALAGAFLNLERHRERPLLKEWRNLAPHDSILGVAGTPAERITMDDEITDIETTLGFVAERTIREEDGHVLIDVRTSYTSVPPPPGSFGGVSGGGIWLTPVQRATDGTLECTGEAELIGVAFWQSDREGEHRWIRGHGVEDIYNLLDTLSTAGP